MELLKLIFYKLYCWQRKHGGGYVLLDTILLITALLYPVTIGSFLYVAFLFGKKYVYFLASPCACVYGIACGILANIFLYIMLSYNKKYLKILLQMHRKYKSRYKWLAFIVIISSLFYFFLGVYLIVPDEVRQSLFRIKWNN